MSERQDNYMSTLFPCPRSGEFIDLNECWHCERRNFCDIRATMLDELYEDE